MSRSFKHSFIAIVVLVSILAGSMRTIPVNAAGATMEIEPLSLPTGWTYGYLQAVWGTGANDVYAVGYGDNGDPDTANALRPLVFHKGSGSWSSTSPTLPSGISTAYLYGVWGSSSTDIYAVGSGRSGPVDVPIMYHGNGSSWSGARLTLPSGWITAVLTSVWGSDTNNVYAAGYGLNGTTVLPLLYQWNSTGWTAFSPLLPTGWTAGQLYGVWGTEANDIFAVGLGSAGGTSLPLIYHWDGINWTVSPAVLPTGWTSGNLKAVWGTASNNVYAVGSGYDGTFNRPLLYQWNGSAWTSLSLTLPTGIDVGYLTGIWGSASTDVYVVGYGDQDGTIVPLLYHRDSLGWSEESPAIPLGWNSDFLYSVWGSSFDDIYAAGSGHNGSTQMPLLYHSSQVEQDAVAPGDITNLIATTGTTSNSVDLSWTAPADDGDDISSGSVASYLVKYSKTPFTNWNNGTPVTNDIAVPVSPGGQQTMTVSGLEPGELYYFAVRAQDEQYNLSANFGTADATAKVFGAGIYDDAESAWVYSGAWQTFSGDGPYNSTLHQSMAAGSYAELGFSGSQIKLTYLKAPGRGSIDVYIDGNKVTTLNSSSPSLVWQATWTSLLLAPGNHTVRFVNAGGGWIDLDAIQVYENLTPVGAGIYDDATNAWIYAGTWTTFSGNGPYSKTLHQNYSVGEYAEVFFTGAQIKLTYLKAPGRGSVEVYIDGNKVTTLNASSPSIVWQATWTSPMLSAGTHTVRFQNAGGGWIDLDAIQVYGNLTPVGAGTYDDADGAWTYSETWQTFSGSGPYNDTLHQNNTTGNYAEVFFNGAQVKLTYLKAPGRGSIDVYIDGSKVDTINASSPSIVWQATWTSSTLSVGNHTVRFQNAGGGWIDLDAIQVYANLTPVGEGTYDGSDSAWIYSGTWQTFSGDGPYSNTLHQSNTTNSNAEVFFNGAQIKLTYLKAPGRGLIDVYIDGTKVTTLNANSSSIVWQATWTSSPLSSGTHMVRFQNAGGGWIDLDAIQVFADVTPVGGGTYDDTEGVWAYSGTWATYTGSGPYSNTLHQSNTTGNYGEVSFNGSQIKLTYLQAPGRGSIDIYIDGSKVDTINANSSGIIWQPTWMSPVLTPGEHTVRFQNAGGGWIDLDAVEVQ